MSESDKEKLSKFTEKDLDALADMARMYQAGRAAICKAILYAITGAVVTAVGMGIKHYLQEILK